MFCQECGNEMPNDAMFCPECGAKQDIIGQSESPVIQNTGSTVRSTGPVVQPKRPLTPEEAAKAAKRNKIILAVVAGVIALCVIIGIASIFIKPTIDLNKYLMVRFEGYDTVGKAYANFDYDKFEDDYGSKLARKLDDEDAYEFFIDNAVSGYLNKEIGLSNGDVVTYTWSCNDEWVLETFGYKLKYENVEYTVSGLKQAETFDPFEGITVTFKGIAPNGTASVSGEPTNEAAQYLKYEIDTSSELSNGDTVTVNIYANYDEDPIDYCIENYGKIPSPIQKTFTVEGLNTYVTSVKEISKEGLKEMKKQAQDVYNAENAGQWDETESLDSFTYLGMYLLKSKERESDWGYDKNIVYLVYKVNIKNKYENDIGISYNNTNTYYWYIGFNSLLVDTKGKLTVDIMDYEIPYEEVIFDSNVDNGWFSTYTWYYEGFSTLGKLYEDVVTSRAATYDCEESMSKDAQEEVDISSMQDSQGLIFPDSSERVLTEEEVEALSSEELRQAINELYARNGYIFNDDTIRAFFEQYDWYKKEVKPEDFTMDLFNSTEKKNVQLMQKIRDKNK